MTKREDIEKAIYDGVSEVFANAGKANPKMYFRDMKPWTPEERKAIDAKTEIAMKEWREKERVFKLTHKYQGGARLYCPRCAEVFELSDDTWLYYEKHVKECVKDCTGCDSFDLEERCAHCYTYSLWAERIQDATR